MIGPKTWDRIVRNFFEILFMAVTVQKVVGCLCGNFVLKCMLDMKKAWNGPFDRSQNMGPNCGNFFRHSWAVRGCWGLNWVFIW